ncbi:family 43 glycosylhydrolase [Nonomuraea sp. NPDC050404]|uniref:family 43 glycosylhydrolase n=1 Tax=Nonomuraea sp. NPDC050404 TaxID=3155783 RepID=UPI0033F924FB
MVTTNCGDTRCDCRPARSSPVSTPTPACAAPATPTTWPAPASSTPPACPATIARGPAPSGPFEPCPHNPLLTARGIDAAVQNVGHADLVQTHDGGWAALYLGVRALGGIGTAKWHPGPRDLRLPHRLDRRLAAPGRPDRAPALPRRHRGSDALGTVAAVLGGRRSLARPGAAPDRRRLAAHRRRAGAGPDPAASPNSDGSTAATSPPRSRAASPAA